MKKFIGMLVAAAMTASVFAGGASDSGSGKTIEFWSVFTGADGSSMQAIIDGYNATNPAYTVNHRAIEANDLYLKLPLAVQSGQDVPDLSIVHIERIRAFKDNGFLTDYTPLLAGSPIHKANYNPKAWTMTDIDGGHYGIPLDVHSFILYVNMDLYKKYGKGALDDGVVTWDEIRAAAPDCVKDGIIPFGMTWLRVKFLAANSQLDGSLSKDGVNPDFNNPIAKKVLQNWKDLYDAGYTQKDGDSPWELFLGGKMLFCPEGQWMYNNVKEAKLNAKMFDYPVFNKKTKGNWTSSHQFVMPANKKQNPEKQKAILDFINYIGNNSIEWARAGQTPAHVSIKANSEFKTMPQAFLAEQNEELKINGYKYYGAAVESLDKILGEVLFGRMTIDEGLNQAVQETKDRISSGQ